MMKLLYSPLSPYARKVRILIIEKGLRDQVELVVANPHEDLISVAGVNPLGRIPALVLDDGRSLYDSRVIVEYLDTLSSPTMMPTGDARFTTLTRIALCEGLLDATFNIATEDNRRAETERSSSFVERWSGAIGRSLAALEADLPRFGDTLAVEHIAAMVALDYVDFRAGKYIDWRLAHPKLIDFHARFSERESMLTTVPSA